MSFLSGLIPKCHAIADRIAGCIDPEVRSDAVCAAWEASDTYNGHARRKRQWCLSKAYFVAMANYRDRYQSRSRMKRGRRVEVSGTLHKQMPERFDNVDRRECSPINNLIFQELLESHYIGDVPHERETTRDPGQVSRLESPAPAATGMALAGS